MSEPAFDDQSDEELNYCQVTFDDLQGRINVTFEDIPPSFDTIYKLNPTTHSLYTPADCTVPSKAANRKT